MKESRIIGMGEYTSVHWGGEKSQLERTSKLQSEHGESGWTCTKSPANPLLHHSGGRVVLAIHRCRKPTIGAITGSAVGPYRAAFLTAPSNN